MAWSFYNIYVRGMRTRFTVIVTWLSLGFIVLFWTWQWTKDMW
jgi:hypothetical protein